MNYDNTCPICFNEFDKDICGNIINIAITKCNHKFCLQCIVLHGKRKYNCPLCRSEFINPTCISPTNALSEEIRRDQEMILDIEAQNELEVNNWYFGEDQGYTQRPLIPRINIVYDASNVTFSVRNENIRNLRVANNRYNDDNQFETDSLDNEYRIYRLQNSIYDLEMPLDNSSSDNDEENQENEGNEENENNEEN